jgi:hypothetical protein
MTVVVVVASSAGSRRILCDLDNGQELNAGGNITIVMLQKQRLI